MKDTGNTVVRMLIRNIMKTNPSGRDFRIKFATVTRYVETIISTTNMSKIEIENHFISDIKAHGIPFKDVAWLDDLAWYSTAKSAYELTKYEIGR